MRLHTPLLLFLVMFGKVVSAAAPNSPDELVAKGIALRSDGHAQEALELFQRVHDAAPSARTLAQIGLAETDLRHWVDAEAHLTDALASHDLPWIQNAKNRDVIEKTLVVIRSHISLVDIVGPSGAEVSVSGRPVGRLPLPTPVHVAEGRVRIDGTAEGRQSAAIDLPVPGGRELTVHLELRPMPPPSRVAEPPAQPVFLEPHPVAESTAWSTWTGGGLLAVSAASITAGIIWIAVDGTGTCNPPAGDRCLRVYDTKAQGWIAAGVGAAAGVAGGLLLWHGTHSEAQVGLGLGTVTAGGVF